MFNWYLLEAAFPEQINKTRLWTAADLTALFGNPNLALSLSAVIAMRVLLRRHKLTFNALAKITETALMSGGVIILITSGGGAFGAVLRECGVKDFIQQRVSSGGAGAELARNRILGIRQGRAVSHQKAGNQRTLPARLRAEAEAAKA